MGNLHMAMEWNPKYGREKPAGQIVLDRKTTEESWPATIARKRLAMRFPVGPTADRQRNGAMSSFTPVGTGWAAHNDKAPHRRGVVVGHVCAKLVAG
ncbi:hypothetical protein D9M71_138940 [compost metagenome]